jgi:BRCA1-associated protein
MICRNQLALRPLPPPSHCLACSAIQTYWEVSGEWMDIFCFQCAMQETLWVCLTCGFVGCGRYSNKHAAQHFLGSGHPYSLELATLRIWDYAEDGEFAHRVDFLDCPSSPPLCRPWTRRDPRISAESIATATSGFQEKNPKKATMIGEEYEALLQSALEEQAQHYEGEIIRLRAELTAAQVDRDSITVEELEEIECIRMDITKLRSRIDYTSRELLDYQSQEAGHRATSQRLLREQQNAQELLMKIRELCFSEHELGRTQVDELEQQIADLTANQRMRHQFSQDEELANAQICGTSGELQSRTGKKGKKTRRFFRK